MNRFGLGFRFILLTVLTMLCLACAPRAEAPRVATDMAAQGPMNLSSAPVEKGAAMEESAMEMAPAPLPLADMDSQESAPAEQRIVIKTVDMSLIVKDPVESMDSIGKMAEEMGGFVVTSNRYQNRLESGKEVPQANITIRVPAERLNETLEKLKLAAVKVQRENVSGQDVTQEYTDQKSRLKNLEAAEADLRKIMDNAYSTEDIMNVYNQLTLIREQIEVVKGRIQYYEQSSALSAVSIELIAEASIEQVTVGGWQPEGIVRDAIQGLINALKFIATVAIWLVIFFLPIAIIIYIPIRVIWALIRRLRARSKAKKVKDEVVSVSSSDESGSTDDVRSE